METTTAKQQFSSGMTVGQAMAVHPGVRWVFAAYHLGGCSHCAISNEETIEQVCEGYGVPLERLMNDLNALLEETADPQPAPGPLLSQG